MANNFIPQGTLNRLRGYFQVNDDATLNVTAPFLGEEMISISFDGNSTDYIRTATGGVASPAPYKMANITLNLIRTTPLAEIYKQRELSNSLLGNCAVYTDSSTLSRFQFNNCSIMSVRDLTINGKDAGYAVLIGGFYYINNNLFSV